jgi:gluconolactonase
MKYLLIILSIVFSTLFFYSCKVESALFKNGENVITLSKGFSFTEGPAADAMGNVYFTDQPNNKIYIWTIQGELKTFSEDAGRANGLYFYLDGDLVACADLNNQLWKISPNGNHTILVADYEGKMLNGPNDLWVHPNGTIYFTDPLYQRPYWSRNPEKEQDGEHVYCFSPKTEKLTKVAEDLVKPNGIVGTPDGKKLYVADIGANKTYVYDIQPDGTLNNRKLFVELGSDGMTIDIQGNVYLTGNSVTVFNPEGNQIAHIPIPAPWTANVCFGGKDHNILFITASDGLYALNMKVKGAR